jgi:outer membrane immunogenic protein
MKRQRYYLLASASTLALAGGGAHAADLGMKAASAAAPASWAGWYAGVNGGVVTEQSATKDLNNWADISYVANDTQKVTAGLFGGHVGYNWQEDGYVYGLEGDFDWVGAKTTDNFSMCPGCTGPGGFRSIGVAQVQTQMNWLSTVRARAGVTLGARQGTLLYVTGGLALAGIKNNWGAGYAGSPDPRSALNPNSFVANNVWLGWTAGVGIEHMFAGMPNWSFRAEALWVQFANQSVSNPGPSTFNGQVRNFTTQFQNQAALARLGVSYKF